MTALALPLDATTDRRIDVDTAADYIELTAFFSGDDAARTSDLANAVSLASEEDLAEGQDEVEEETVSSAVYRIKERGLALEAAYPFWLNREGSVLTCVFDEESFGHSTYILSLLLSHLRALSPILAASDLHPSEDEEVPRMREYFQYAATAALAAEVQGQAWSFGSPRPDKSGFLPKLKEIWQTLRDGRVEAQVGAPTRPKDDQIDVFAARTQADRSPGFLLAAAQVATGKNAWEKSVKGHIDTFRKRWFGAQPSTDFIPYMIVPFARADKQFVDDVRVMGNVLHRLRVPQRVAEAESLVQAGVSVEAYDRLSDVAAWVNHYRNRARAA